MAVKITDTIWAAGKVIQRPNIQLSFISYLLKGKKNVLIDTVSARVAVKWWEEITAIVPYQELDAVILNHSEEDHSGALQLVLSWRPEIPIYCTAACSERLKKEYPYANFVCVEDRSEIQIGDFEFRFVHTPGLHWEDNMVTFFENERILFSNDLFGQYVGEESLSDEAVPSDMVIAGLDTYYEKILSVSTVEQRKILAEIKRLGFEKIAPGHGVVLSRTLPEVLANYSEKFL